MARTRTDPGDVFSFAELALAGGLSRSTYQFLEKSQLLPGGRGLKDFKRVSIIGAFVAGGVSLLGAAWMAKTIVNTEFNQKDGETPSGVEDLFIRNFGFKREVQAYNDYWYHLELYKNGLRAGDKTQRSDVVIEIVERSYVFHRRGDIEVNRIEEPEMRDKRAKLTKKRADLRKRARAMVDAGRDRNQFAILFLKVNDRHFGERFKARAIPALEPPSAVRHAAQLACIARQKDANLVGWLEGWQRGFEPRLVHVSEKVPFDSDDITAVKLFQQLNTEAQHARNNAVGMLTVNISLAIRRALDHLADYRNGRATRAAAPVKAIAS